MTDTRLAIIVTATLTCATIASNLYGNWATRRQMRQNELRRADPSIPVEPPPTAAGLFIRKWAFFILAVAAHVYILTHVFRQPPPVTIKQVVIVSYIFGSLFFLFNMQLTFSLSDNKLTTQSLDRVSVVLAYLI